MPDRSKNQSSDRRSKQDGNRQQNQQRGGSRQHEQSSGGSRQQGEMDRDDDRSRNDR
jgi:hypothetical protein